MSKAAKMIEQTLIKPRSRTARAAQAVAASMCVGGGVALAAFLKPRKDDWSNKEDDPRNALLIGASVASVLVGLTAGGVMAHKASVPVEEVTERISVEEEEKVS